MWVCVNELYMSSLKSFSTWKKEKNIKWEPLLLKKRRIICTIKLLDRIKTKNFYKIINYSNNNSFSNRNKTKTDWIWCKNAPQKIQITLRWTAGSNERPHFDLFEYCVCVCVWTKSSYKSILFTDIVINQLMRNKYWNLTLANNTWFIGCCVSYSLFRFRYIFWG